MCAIWTIPPRAHARRLLAKPAAAALPLSVTSGLPRPPRAQHPQMYEAAPRERRGLATSLNMVGTSVGAVLGLIATLLLTALLTKEQMTVWWVGRVTGARVHVDNAFPAIP